MDRYKQVLNEAQEEEWEEEGIKEDTEIESISEPTIEQVINGSKN